MPTTATGLLAAITPAISSAFPSTSFLPPCTTSLTNPNDLASSAPNFLPVRASSRTRDSLPAILGRRWRVPMSAARPTLTSCGSSRQRRSAFHCISHELELEGHGKRKT